mmetsp:Transcript_22971/g.32092  ORF Transcript_22971/g.32092 Transcript_22971/m.32092 type:complete len:693 (+) Transcript_22971:372-2450(+)|eukprot:CAMPEP_0184479916 /NCGR_PEP_ID=MMETSP0113_2-20130426/1445_1 /TAXON_ID=91329 /ORGANISM="Norrisiella sphaerica, Strain BC52" /LENGTH=692 /DNA_ID=CAMNT_0026858085 /DNA_START=372 /DNA_END=2450 /DNA_ORIENTATION=+
MIRSRKGSKRAVVLGTLLVFLALGQLIMHNCREEPVGRRPVPKPLGKLNIKLGLMPFLSKGFPKLSITIGDYKFDTPEKLNLEDLVGNFRPPAVEILGDLNTGNVLNSSNLMIPGRQIWVITTAALPWRTGTSVNPTLRAAYLQRLTPAAKVSLMVPWVEAVDQIKVMGGHKFTSMKQQEKAIRKWIAREAGMPDVAHKLNVIFYKGRYHPEYGSIFPVEDLLALIPTEESDVAILEEPEHLNWFHPETPEYWRQRFNHVVGIMHTNYLAYTQEYQGGYYKKYILYLLNRWMVPAHCDKVVKLSGVLQRYSSYKETVENVHGVRSDFLKVGEQASRRGFKKGFYFIGKALQAKGLPILFELMSPKTPAPLPPQAPIEVPPAVRSTPPFFSAADLPEGLKPANLERILPQLYKNGVPPSVESLKENIKGMRKEMEGLGIPPPPEFNGLNQEDIESTLEAILEPESRNIRMTTSTPMYRGLFFKREGRVDPKVLKAIKELQIDVYGSGPDRKLLENIAKSRGLLNVTFHDGIDHLELKDYKAMINPSISEVLCTTTAEALAMGKFVICPSHESNNFFRQFPNCLMYSTPAEFRERIAYAQTHDPEPLSPEVLRKLTWEAATERLIEASQITEKMSQAQYLDDVGAKFHTWLGKGKKGNVIRRIAGAAPLLDPRPEAAEAEKQQKSDTMTTPKNI